MEAEQNNNNNENSDTSHFYKYILIVRIESLRSLAQSSVGVKKFQCLSIIKLSLQTLAVGLQ